MIDSCLDRYLNTFACQIPVSSYSCITVNFICAFFCNYMYTDLFIAL